MSFWPNYTKENKMKPSAEGFTNEMMRWPPSWFHIVRETWGELKNPWGLGTQARFCSKLDCFVRLIVLETKVCLITPTATFMPMPSIRSIWFADFLWGISLRSKRFQSSYCATVRAGAKKKKRWKGEGEGRRGNACPRTPRFWKTPLEISRFGSFVNWQLVKIEV